MSVYHLAVRQTEEHLMNSWPSLRTVMCDGWVFREANGYTKRANSAAALEARGRFSATLDEAERFYSSLGSPTVFRLTPLAGPDPDRILEDHGYGMVDETIVMRASLEPAAGASDGVRIDSDCSAVWETGYAKAHALSAETRLAHRAILDRIVPLPRAFASIHEGGRPVAFGLGVLERDHLGLFDIVTMPEERRRGGARRLVQALMEWGTRHGAQTAWLSVIADNEKAKPLYAQMGFRELYRYHYRVSEAQDG